ncbi:MAG: hypothetical protein RQ783_09630 [Gammaproteobacteria bacterium]|nr:hypothetical protein [Gammaproteobacteria bacterium]
MPVGQRKTDAPASVVVCIGSSAKTQKLIAATAEYARDSGVPLKILHVSHSTQNTDGADALINKNLAIANLLDADRIKIVDSDVTHGILTIF